MTVWLSDGSVHNTDAIMDLRQDPTLAIAAIMLSSAIMALQSCEFVPGQSHLQKTCSILIQSVKISPPSDGQAAMVMPFWISARVWTSSFRFEQSWDRD